MSRFIESIKLLDGRFYNLPYHQRRMDDTLWSVTGKRNPYNLHQLLQPYKIPQQGLYKCRILYSSDTVEIGVEPYAVKPITSLKVVRDDGVNYPYKYEDRSAIQALYVQRGPCDDVLIIKDDWVTDTSFANVVFKKGKEWFTPAYPLLRGTQRQKLLDEGLIREEGIRVSDLRTFQSIKLINALLEFNGMEIDVLGIVL